MASVAGGWFELETDGVAPGEAYAFVLDDGRAVPDPAARAQVGDVHGPSKLTDPDSFRWRCGDWRGRRWEETVIYELHTGTFTAEGIFDGVRARLDYLAGLGVTAIELMPVAQFGGRRGWGYDGVLLYAPHNAYGTADDLKELIDAAHERGLMVFLDVVYNHFGPDGNYLGLYAPDFFDPDRHTPWGAAIGYEKEPVRRFFIENALYWLGEFRLDGLRLDAIDNIRDPSEPHILVDLATEVRQRFPERAVHLATEDERNIVRLHEPRTNGRPRLYTAEWNDDVHNVVHVIATGERDGYYADFIEDPIGKLGRALAEGFVYQGEVAPSKGHARGVPSTGVPLTAFVAFNQNHDQVGNRAFGDRLLTLADPELVRVLTAALLLSPQIPLLWMGEEFGAREPFQFFTDFHGELGTAVREGRRREFAAFRGFDTVEEREAIPDPNAPETFARSRLDWPRAASAVGRDWLAFYRLLIAIRTHDIAPRLVGLAPGCGAIDLAADNHIAVSWRLDDGSRLTMALNLAAAGDWTPPTSAGRVLFALPASRGWEDSGAPLPAKAIRVTLAEPAGGTR